MKIGLLSTIEERSLGHRIAAIYSAGLKIDCVLLDARVPTEKEHRIEEERIEGKLKEISPYDFGELRIPFFAVDDHRSPITEALVKNRKLDILVSAGTPRILPRRMLDATRYGVLNCHPGLLPEYRGCTCVEWAIWNDEKIGNTVHFMAEEIDTGPVVLTETIDVAPGDVYSDVRVKVYKGGYQLMAEALKAIKTGKIDPNSLQPQRCGNYYHVIPDRKLAIVKQKLIEGRYKGYHPGKRT